MDLHLNEYINWSGLYVVIRVMSARCLVCFQYILQPGERGVLVERVRRTRCPVAIERLHWVPSAEMSGLLLI